MLSLRFACLYILKFARLLAHVPWNVFQIGISGWFTGSYNIRCQPVDYSDHPSAARVSVAVDDE